ncbi:hypothetical protein M0804_003716 [Polistes exclamans]|nr:hypothetical protein M0804_003716 [Polistes exclamans]
MVVCIESSSSRYSQFLLAFLGVNNWETQLGPSFIVRKFCDGNKANSGEGAEVDGVLRWLCRENTMSKEPNKVEEERGIRVLVEFTIRDYMGWICPSTKTFRHSECPELCHISVPRDSGFSIRPVILEESADNVSAPSSCLGPLPSFENGEKDTGARNWGNDVIRYCTTTAPAQPCTTSLQGGSGVAPILTLLLCLDEVIKDARAISGASRPDEQAENRQTPGCSAVGRGWKEGKARTTDEKKEKDEEDEKEEMEEVVVVMVMVN